MIIGHGLLGKQFSSYEDNTEFLIFCSGVSNSTCTNPAEFQREHNLLQQAIHNHQNKQFVYFSTCSVYDPSQRDRPYVQHKLQMEEMIQADHPHFLIVRTSNLVGKTNNPNTVLNFFFQAIQEEKSISLWANAERNLIDVLDVYKAVHYILEKQLFHNSIVTIANTQSYPVLLIIKTLEDFLGKKARYTLEEKGQAFNIPLQEIKPIYERLGLEFDADYLSHLLERYYTV